MSLAKIAGVATLAFAGATGMWWLCSPRVTDQYVSLKVQNGRVIQSHVESGKKMDAIFPNREYVRLPGWIQEFSVEATEQTKESIRTIERAQVYGVFKIQYQLDRDDKNIGNVYSELKIDEEKDMETLHSKIKSFVSPAANKIYSQISMMSINDDLVGVGKKIAEELQKQLDAEGYTYVKIRSVLPNGVGLSNKANTDLEQILSEQRKMKLLDEQAKVAEKSVEVTRKQASVTLEAIQEYKKAGMTSSEALQAYYLQLLQVNDKVGTPGVPGPIPNTSNTVLSNNR